MTFFRNKQERVEWKKWLVKNRDHLVLVCGVPGEIVGEKDRWGYLVEHGEFDGWNIGMLNDVAAEGASNVRCSRVR
jgi:hypothetical protein